MTQRMPKTKRSDRSRERTDASKSRTDQPEQLLDQQADAQNASVSENMLVLQRMVGNAAVQRLMRKHDTAELANDTTQHGRGCGCAACGRISRAMMPEVIQREGGVKETAAKLEKEELTKKFEPATLTKAPEMTALAGKLTIKEFFDLGATHNIALKPLLKAIFTYWTPVTLADVGAKVKAADADARKTVWSDSALMTLADTKLGRDSYLTFVTYLGMHYAPTTDELGEGGKEHTPAPEADKLIRDKLSAYVTNAVAAGRKIEGQVGVVASADWDRAGIAHYGEEVWNTGPPPKTPKKDAINGFVDAKGRVWIERNSGNPGTLIHEGVHKYASDNMLDTLGFDLNEGTTEYFTRIICKDLSIDRGNYESQYKLISTLVANVASKQVLAAAYFDGNVDGLKNAFLTYRKDTKKDSEKRAERIWKRFLKKTDDGDFAKAERYIR